MPQRSENVPLSVLDAAGDQWSSPRAWEVSTLTTAPKGGVALSGPAFISDGIGAKGDATAPVGALAGSVVALLVLANLVALLPARRARRSRSALSLNQE